MGNQQTTFFTYKSAVDGPEYDANPNYNQDRLHSDYTGFYAGIGIITAFAGGVLDRIYRSFQIHKVTFDLQINY